MHGLIADLLHEASEDGVLRLLIKVSLIFALGRKAFIRSDGQNIKTNCFPIVVWFGSVSKDKDVVYSLNCAISSRKIFNVSSNETVYLCRSIFNCSNIKDILCIRRKTFFQKYCSLDNIVCAKCSHQADVKLASLDV